MSWSHQSAHAHSSARRERLLPCSTSIAMKKAQKLVLDRLLHPLRARTPWVRPVLPLVPEDPARATVAAELLHATVERLEALPWAGTEAGLPAEAALLCAAGLGGDTAIVAKLRTRMRGATHAPLRALDRAEDFLGGRGRMGHFAPSLPMLPVETVYALFEVEAERIRRKP